MEAVLFPEEKQGQPGFLMVAFPVESAKLVVFEATALPNNGRPVWRVVAEIDGRMRSYVLEEFGDYYWATEDAVPIVSTRRVFHESAHRVNDLKPIFRAAIVKASQPTIPMMAAANRLEKRNANPEAA